MPKVHSDKYRHLIRDVISRNPRKPCEEEEKVLIPGFGNLYEFSKEREALLKAECGGAWQSYVLRSHWRMIFPISRTHQQNTADRLAAVLKKQICPIVHLVTFPALTINHGMILFDVRSDQAGLQFFAYDPNDPQKPTQLTFDPVTRTFSLPANAYWAGGKLNVIEIYQSWFM